MNTTNTKWNFKNKQTKKHTQKNPNKTPQLVFIIFYKQQHKLQTALCGFFFTKISIYF